MDVIWHIFLVPFQILSKLLTYMFSLTCNRGYQTSPGSGLTLSVSALLGPQETREGGLLVNFQHLTGHKVALRSHWIYLKCASTSFQKFLCPLSPSLLCIPLHLSIGADFPRASVIYQQQCFYWPLGKDLIHSQRDARIARRYKKRWWQLDTSTDVSLYLGRSSHSWLFCTQS